MNQNRLSTALFLLFVVVGLAPILMMTYNTFIDINTIDLKQLLKSSESFKRSMVLSLFVAIFTTFIGTLLGIILGKSDLKFSKFFLTLFIIPLLIPPNIIALGWIDLIGVNGFLSELLFGFFGTFWVLFCIYLPIPILLSIFFLKQIDPALEDAGRVYTSDKGTLKKIVLPLITPAILLSFLLVFILSFGEYSVANVLRYHVFPLESFIQFSAFYDFKTAMLTSMPMLIIALLAVLIEQIYINKKRFKYRTFNTYNTIKLTHKEQVLTTIFISCSLFLIVFLPIFTIFFKIGSWESFSIALSKAMHPLIRTIIYGFSGATVLMIFGFLYGYIIEFKIGSFWKILDAGIILLFTLPATLLGISLILFYNRSFLEFIYTSPIIIIIGYFTKYLLLSTKITQTKLSSIPKSMTQAAQTTGANWFQTLRFILIPLSKSTLVTIFLVGFIFSIRENSITMLVYPPSMQSLPVYITTQMANANPEIIASFCTIMIFVTLLPLLFLSIRLPNDRV